MLQCVTASWVLHLAALLRVPWPRNLRRPPQEFSDGYFDKMTAFTISVETLTAESLICGRTMSSLSVAKRSCTGSERSDCGKLTFAKVRKGLSLGSTTS